jgi:hypothetical protein
MILIKKANVEAKQESFSKSHLYLATGKTGNDEGSILPCTPRMHSLPQDRGEQFSFWCHLASFVSSKQFSMLTCTPVQNKMTAAFLVI